MTCWGQSHCDNSRPLSRHIPDIPHHSLEELASHVLHVKHFKLGYFKKGWNCTAMSNLILSLCSVGGSGTVTLLQRYSQWQPVTDVDTGLRTRQQLSSEVVILSPRRVLTAHSKNSIFVYRIQTNHWSLWMWISPEIQDAWTCRPGIMTGWIIAEKSCHCGSWSDIKLETVFPYPHAAPESQQPR